MIIPKAGFMSYNYDELRYRTLWDVAPYFIFGGETHGVDGALCET